MKLSAWIRCATQASRQQDRGRAPAYTDGQEYVNHAPENQRAEGREKRDRSRDERCEADRREAPTGERGAE